jgi:hypothetical protein
LQHSIATNTSSKWDHESTDDENLDNEKVGTNPSSHHEVGKHHHRSTSSTTSSSSGAGLVVKHSVVKKAAADAKASAQASTGSSKGVRALKVIKVLNMAGL